MSWVTFIVIAVFLGIVISLFSGLRFLLKDGGDSRRAVKALTMRVGLSVGLFAFLMLLIALGVIKPHGIYPTANPPASSAE